MEDFERAFKNKCKREGVDCKCVNKVKNFGDFVIKKKVLLPQCRGKSVFINIVVELKNRLDFSFNNYKKTDQYKGLAKTPHSVLIWKKRKLNKGYEYYIYCINTGFRKKTNFKNLLKDI